MRFRSGKWGAMALLVTSVALGEAPAADGLPSSTVANDDPALVRLKALLAPAEGAAKAPQSPRYSALCEPTFHGTRVLVGWLLPGLDADDRPLLAALAAAFGRPDGGRLAVSLAKVDATATGSVSVETLATASVLVLAVSSPRGGLAKDLELAVLQATAELAEGTDTAVAKLARRALGPRSRAVVEVHPPEAPHVAVRVPKPLRHVIERGDTLSEIARSAGLDLDALVRLNGMDPKKPIHPGEELKLNAGAPRPKLYVAKQGDTLAKVARQFGVSEKALLDVNRIETRQLRPGQKLVLPP